MKEIIIQRIKSLREFLFENQLSAFIIPSADPHLSEYTAPHWKSREWISGFTGSAGTVVITTETAGLWTDSRYFLQAAEELEGSSITLFKEGLPETPSLTQWLCENLPTGSTIGIDGKMFSIIEVEQMHRLFSAYELELKTDMDPMEEIWKDRPSIPQNPAFIYDLKYAGETCRDKVRNIREELQQNHAEGLLVSALDEIAWTLNIRGNDVKCNPVVISYLYITMEEVIWFVSPEKVTNEVAEYLHKEGVQIKNYSDLESHLAVTTLKSLQMAPAKTNDKVYNAVNPECSIIFADSPIALLKAVRNETQIQGLKKAMIKDGVALVKFLQWLEYAVPTGNETEISVSRKLTSFRAEQELFMGTSFDTIAGYKEHGAIVHYSATEKSNSVLVPASFLLLDSGAQYLDGTTDITRTIPLGQLTEEEKTDYTLVLKGHISLATCQFPQGTRGAQIDVLARLHLWKQGMNYLHGTGHGVGHFLSVHEGPQSIRLNENPTVLVPGMLTSNEPGVYKKDKHGIRIENLILTVADRTTDFGGFYKFETMTLCPIDKRAIIVSLLTQEEIEWIDSYHKMVFDKLSPYLNEDETLWLEEKCSNLI